MRRNIDQARRTLEQHPDIQQVHLDGDSEEVIIRAIVEDLTEDRRLPDSVQAVVDEIPNASMVRDKYLGFAREVTLR